MLRGPNIWASFPVIEAWIDLGDLNETSSETVPGFNDRLKEWLPSLIEHRCSVGERGGFFQRLDRGTYPAHILEHITLELQCLAGTPVGFGKARAVTEPGVYRVVFRYEDETLGKEALNTGRRLLLAALHNTPFDIAAEVERLRGIAYDNLLGPSTRSIVKAAKDRGIPTRRLNQYSLVQLGYGAKQKRIQAAETSLTGAIAEGIAQDKEMTRKLLSAAGVPTPYGWVVTDVEAACAAAEEIGFPVVVKPSDGNQGKGVATNLTSLEEVRTAFEAASKISSSMVVETHIPGDDYRLLIVGNKLSAAARRDPAHIIGNGKDSIAQLVEETNRDPRRADGHAAALSKIKIDEIALAVLISQGYTPDAIPPRGEKILIRRNANLSTGGTAVDVTDEVHPEVAKRAIEAARVVGLDIAGVDVVARGIATPLEESGGVVVEVNAAPGLRMHLEPSEGTPRSVGNDIVSTLFADGDHGRIPIVAVSGVNGKTTTVRSIAHILRYSGLRVGMTTTDGVYLDTRRIEAGDCSGPRSAGKILMNPFVDAAVFETARGGILREGLGFDRCDVAVMTNIGDGDHLGLNEIHTPEDLAWVKQCIVDSVCEGGTAVLNGADPLVVRMAKDCRGTPLFFARDERCDVIAGQRAAGGRVVFVRNGQIVLAEGPNETELIDIASVPLTCGGKALFHVENILAAVGAAWSLGIPLDTLRDSLRLVSNATADTRGRFSIVEINGGTVVVDYGHNTDALGAVVATLDTFPATRRSAVYGVAGDRRDIDIIDQGKILGRAFDKIYIYEDDDCLRGRAYGDTVKLFREGIELPENRAAEVIPVVGSLKACQLAVEALQPGELLLLQIDNIDASIAWIQECLQGKSKNPT